MYKVIIVEDEEIIRKGIIFSIDWASQECVLVGEGRNGEEGIRLIKEQNPDIVFADINMPIMDGLEMIRQTCESYHYASIIISGYNNFDFAQKAIRYGVRGYLLKPIDPAELMENLNFAKEEVELRRAYEQKQYSEEEWKNTKILPKKKEGAKNLLVEEMLKFVENNYSQKIIFSDLSEQMKYSETYLNRQFKEVMGTTFNDYLNRYRVFRASEMLRETHESVQDIAWKSGVGEYKYFRIVFQKYMGCTPKEYRNIFDK